MTKTHTRWAYEYLPYTARDGRKIPCFRIYPEHAGDAYVAETNKHLGQAVQEKYACLIAAAARERRPNPLIAGDLFTTGGERDIEIDANEDGFVLQAEVAMDSLAIVCLKT